MRYHVRSFKNDCIFHAKYKSLENLIISPGQRAADDVMRVVKYTGDGDEQQRRDASFHRGLLDDAARTDGA